jgi:ATP synthase F1 gamma subunit
MAGKLKFYSERLASFTKFQKIVRTIRMISLAKFRQTMPRAKNRDLALRYTEKCFKLAEYEEDKLIEAATKTQVIVSISTNRGSCGAINSNLNKYIESIIDTSDASNKSVKLVALHKKGSDSLSKLFPDNFSTSIMHDFKHPLSFHYGSFIWETANTVVAEDKLERIEIAYNRFVSAGAQRQAVINIPAFPAWMERITEAATSEKDKENCSFANALLSHEEETIREYYDFQASLAVTHCVLENELAEYAARVVAVEGQLTNIDQLKGKFQYLYNKTRQGAITAALIEILSAMSSMEGSATKGVKKNKFW